MRSRPLSLPLPALVLALGLLILTASAAVAPAVAQGGPEPTGLSLEPRGQALATGNLSVTLTLEGPEDAPPMPVSVAVDGQPVLSTQLAPGEHPVELEGLDLGIGRVDVTATAGPLAAQTSVTAWPGWLSVVPPLLALILALIFRDVLVALFAGVLSGTLIAAGGNPVAAFARSIDSHIAPALADLDHAKIVIFSVLLGGMVGVISKSGGTLGIVEAIRGFASSVRRGQIATWLMGLAIFFDDYANTLIVGTTMRPITDRLRISREKLAYLVDSTAAPVASLLPISTWIGFEVGLIDAALTDIGVGFEPYSVFVASIPYRFYPLFALVLVFAVAWSGRDFGPMLAAETRARTTGELLSRDDKALADYASDALTPPEGVPHRAVNAVVPILAVIGVTLAGLWVSGTRSLAADGVSAASVDGTGAWIREVFAAANSYDALLWASLSGVVLAVLLPTLQRIVTIAQAMEGLVEGFKSMMLAMAVLLLAWSIGSVCAELDTATYLVGLAEGRIPMGLLPVLVFLISAATAFATGSSWGAMGILIPLVIPIHHGLALTNGLGPDDSTYFTLLLGTISSVLAGSVWGDHCSPISDTTVLSSMASSCDHIAHVRTQLPYALAIGVLGMVVGDIPTAYGLSPWISLALGIVVIALAVRFLFRPVPPAPEEGRPGVAAESGGA